MNELSRLSVKVIAEQQRPLSPSHYHCPPTSSEQHQDQGGSALDEEEWKIVRIVGKRRKGKGYEYKVCWKNIWLLERELETHRNCCGSWRPNARRSGESNGEDWNVQTRTGKILDA